MFRPTLYIGEHKHGLYALPSLVDSSTVHVITSQSRRPLIDGPREPGQSADTNGGSGQSGSYFKLHDQPERPKQLQIGETKMARRTSTLWRMLDCAD